MSRTISSQELVRLVGMAECPVIVDVRREAVFRDADRRIAGALWRDHTRSTLWAAEVAVSRTVVVYCTHGHNVGELAAAQLRQCGVEAVVLEGGIDAYVEAGGVTVANHVSGITGTAEQCSVWVTRARPKIDRIACPWLIRRFVDPLARFHFVAPEWVSDVAAEMQAIPFDVENVHYSHRGEQCTFDTMIAEFSLRDTALAHLARIVRAADTGTPQQEAQAHGLLAISLGLSAVEPDDLRQLEKGMTIYDALYGWCRHATGETHNWQGAS